MSKSKGSENNWVDVSNVNKAISLIIDLMKANAEVNLLEWMQALRCVGESIKVLVAENIEELAKSTLDDEEQGEPARAEGDKVNAD